MTNAKENYLIGRIDAAKDLARPALKPQRAMYLRMQARLAFSRLLSEIECPMERAAFIENMLDVGAEHLHPLIGRVSAATRLNAISADVCAVFRLDRAISRARADQVFAANDGDAG